jgi:hypothetical protein
MDLLHLEEKCKKKFHQSGISQPIVLSNPSVAHNASANIIMHNYGTNVEEIGSCACLLLQQFSQVKCFKFHMWGQVRPYHLT